MSYDEALKILDLKPGFNEDDLRKSYRRKMREWHPDICKSSNAEEMSKKINEAKEILSNSKKSTGNVNNNYNYSYYSENFEELNTKRMEYIYKIMDIYAGADMIGIDGESSNSVMFKILFERAHALGDLVSCHTIDDLDNIYTYYYNRIYILLKAYIEYFCGETGMDLTYVDYYKCIVDGKYEITINRNIYEVYCDLVKAKSKRNIFKKIYYKVAEYM